MKQLKSWLMIGLQKGIQTIRKIGIGNGILFLVIGYLLYHRVPQMWQMYQSEGVVARPVKVWTLTGNEMGLPSPQRQVVVFWATWCGPCKVELSRLNAMVEKADVKPEQILAISSGEPADVVAASVQDRGYRFNVALDPQGQAAMDYQINGTPTILFIDESGQIQWMTMGLSPSLEFRVKHFLASKN